MFFLCSVPPQRVLVLDAARQPTRGGKAGPFDEGAEMKLICRAEGGRPPPALHWLRDGQLIDDSHQVVSEPGVGVRPSLAVENTRKLAARVWADWADVMLLPFLVQS